MKTPFLRCLSAGVATAFALLLGACAVTAPASPPAYFLSLQDGRAGLADGASTVRDSADSLAVIELAGGRLRLLHQVPVPTSLVGPPSSIAVAPGGRLALVTASTRRDPADARRVVPYDLVSVLALDPDGGSAPRVLASLHTGAGAAGVSINRAGTFALVANRIEGSVSLLAIEAGAVRVSGKVSLGEKSSPAHVAFLPDGRSALVSRDGDHKVTVLKIDGNQVTVDPRDLVAGVRPYGLDIASSGDWAAVTNLGGGQGDSDTVSLIDLRSRPLRVVDTVSVGQTPEGAFFAPDSSTLGVTVIDGGNKPAASPFHGTARFRQFRIADGRLLATGEVRGGSWLQGAAYAGDSRSVVVQDAAARQLRVYRTDGTTMSDTGERLGFDAAPCAIVRWR